jgi:hypothetical protein
MPVNAHIEATIMHAPADEGDLLWLHQAAHDRHFILHALDGRLAAHRPVPGRQLAAWRQVNREQRLQADNNSSRAVTRFW